MMILITSYELLFMKPETFHNALGALNKALHEAIHLPVAPCQLSKDMWRKIANPTNWFGGWMPVRGALASAHTVRSSACEESLST